jgi:hypothetical protein
VDKAVEKINPIFLRSEALKVILIHREPRKTDEI